MEVRLTEVERLAMRELESRVRMAGGIRRRAEQGWVTE